MTNSPTDLTRLLDTLDANVPRAWCHFWLIDLLAWVRAGMGRGRADVQRVPGAGIVPAAPPRCAAGGCGQK